MDVMLDLADRVAVMHHGALLVCDTPDTVMANAHRAGGVPGGGALEWRRF